MTTFNNEAKALFISSDGNIYPDYLICSGKLFDNPPCPYSNDGRIPDLKPLDPSTTNYSLDKGKAGDLCPPCAKQQLGNLGHWEGHRGNSYPEELKRLRLFKCSQWLWLVVPRLAHDSPRELESVK